MFCSPSFSPTMVERAMASLNRPDSEPSSVKLVALGAPRLTCSVIDGLAATLGPSKPLALIGYLALAPQRTASRDRLCDLLWGDRDIDEARTQLRQTIWLIKRETGHEIVKGVPHGVAVVADLTIDCRDFASAVEAN